MPHQHRKREKDDFSRERRKNRANARRSAPGRPFGADYGVRTRYLDLGKVALYQMSYARKRKIDYTRESRICQPLRSTFFNFFSKEFR